MFTPVFGTGEFDGELIFVMGTNAKNLIFIRN